MFQKVWKCIEVVVALWGFFTIVAIIADAARVLPSYDIYYRKKTDITPVVSQYPGQDIRLSAEFANSVDTQKLERVSWNLRDSSGKEYTDLPHLSQVDVTLVPDFSGTVTVAVTAKLVDEKEEMHGSVSFQIVQKKPRQLVFVKDGTFLLSTGTAKIDLKSVQLYGGSANWLPALATTLDPDRVRLMTEGRSFPTWDGKAYLRYKSGVDPTGLYQIEAVTASAGDP